MAMNQDYYENDEKHDFLKKLLPRVFRTEGDWVEFDPSKIYQSIIKETHLDKNSADKITEIVVRRIISSGIKFLSGPHIREIVCSVLSEQHYEEERKLYTRIGMPLMDYEAILNFGVNENANQDMNPESIHHWAANRISEEYALLRILNSEEAHAHLYGDIHVHMLRYFDLRPFCQAWDARMILENGLPPVSNWPHCSRSGAAGSLRVAVTHLAKWLGIIQGEFSLPYWEDVLIEEDGILKWRKIGEVVEENTKELSEIYTFSFNPQTLNMERQKISQVHKHQCWEPFLKLKLEYGREITVTRHHSVFTIKNSDIIPVRGGELKVGDYIVVPRKLNYNKNCDEIDIIDLINKNSKNPSRWYVKSIKKYLNQEDKVKLKEIDKWANEHIRNDSIPLEKFNFLNFPKKMRHKLLLGIARSPYTIPATIPITKDFLFILGIFIAEGSGCDKKFSFTLGIHEEKLIEELKERFNSVFGISLKDRHPHDSVNQLSIESDLFRELFQDLFLCGKSAKSKKIPSFIYGLKEKYIRSFLRGYFLGDGHCRNSNEHKRRIRNEITCKSTSNNLIQGLNFLLLKLGIVPSIKYGKKINRLSIYGKKFLDDFLHNFNQSNIRWKSEDPQYRQSPLPLTIPTNHSGLKNYYGENLDLNDKERRYINKKERIGRYKLHKILEKCSDDSYKLKLTRFLNSDLTLLKIKEIKELPKEKFAYDFEVKPEGRKVENFVAGKGLVIAHNSGGQGYDYVTTFLAPYVRGLSDREIEQSMQCLIFETNQIFAARGGQVPFTSISCTPTVPNGLTEIPAIGPKGKIVGSYGDYKEECLKLFDALTDVYIDGDHNGKLFAFPKHEVKVKKEWLKEFEPSYLKVMKEAIEMGTPYFLNMCPDWMPDEIHSQCCRKFLRGDEIVSKCVLDPEKRNKGGIWEDYVTIGSLQSVSLNLPRYAYLADDEDQYFEILDEKMELCSRILIKKWRLMEKRLETGHLPLCSGTIDGKPIFKIEDQNLSIGFTGLNEAVKSLTNMELHEDENAYELGKEILNYMVAKCNTMSERDGYSYSLWEQPAESSSGRFAKLDLKHFPKKAIPQSSGESAYYTNSSHFRYDARMPLYERIRKQGDYHPIVGGGVISHIWLGEQKPDINGLWELTKNICLNTNTAYFAYTTDFTYCPQCQKMFRGGQWTCPSCLSEDVKVYSRITGYYSEVNRYNDGKRAEWESRKRENIT
ncbi:MAG: anaerobic ribonucleoside-triphosphate reductase [Candidatus Lokiarchaeota archaeon]|nr:anaerobic ribonucleoside-triphosphate reductase [Candidatus Lokiarchaeota archaeon]